MWIKNVAGQKLVFCLLTEVTLCFPFKADHDSNIVFYKAKDITIMLFALAFMKCPFTESCCCIQHLVAMYY